MPNDMTINEEAGLGPNWVPVNAEPIIPGRPAAPPVSAAVPTVPQFMQGTTPPAFQHDASFVDTAQTTPSAPKFSLMPLGINQNPATNAAIQSTVTKIFEGGNVQAVELQTNGVDNPVQNKLNLIAGSNVQLSSDSSGGVTVTGTAGGDGITHGTSTVPPLDSVWAYDPAWNREMDDFLSINSSTAGDGSALSSSFSSGAMWNFVSSTFASDPPYWTSGGPIPNLGLLNIPNNATTNQANFLLRGPFTAHGMPLLDYPGWKMAWVFQVGRVRDFPNGGSPTPAFSWTKVSMYAGLANWPTGNSAAAFGNTTTPRPPFFLGLRYDTDTTAPSIGDTQFVFEYVNQALATSYSRNNTQGTTQATGINAVEGNWYRFEMGCQTAGQVVMSLSDGTTTFEAVISVAQITTTINPGAVSVSNGTVQVSYGLNLLPVGVGTKLALSYSGGGTAVSGNFSQFDVNTSSTVLTFFGTGTGGVPTTSSASFYPAFVPCFVFGNDSQASPTAWSKGVSIDYYAFVWNPNLGPNAPGSPNSLKSRYW